VSWFYPRLQTAIDSYRETGSSFEAFLTKYLLISAKEYHVRTTTKSVIEYSAWSARIPDMYTYEEPPIYLAAHERPDNNTENELTQFVFDKNGRKNTKRVLALILKCYYYVSENFAERIAPTVGLDSKELKEMLSKIRKLREKKDDEIYLLKERIHCQFYRCIIYENRLSLFQENSAAYDKLKHKLEKARQRLERMRRRMAGIRTEATNRQIADVIGITKGTVDASLHRLKTRWEIMSKKANLN
jgi:Fe-S-cluster containining protein